MRFSSRALLLQAEGDQCFPRDLFPSTRRFPVTDGRVCCDAIEDAPECSVWESCSPVRGNVCETWKHVCAQGETFKGTCEPLVAITCSTCQSPLSFLMGEILRRWVQGEEGCPGQSWCCHTDPCCVGQATWERELQYLLTVHRLSSEPRALPGAGHLILLNVFFSQGSAWLLVLWSSSLSHP